MSFPFLEPKVLVELLLSSSGHVILASVPVGVQTEQLCQIYVEKAIIKNITGKVCCKSKLSKDEKSCTSKTTHFRGKEMSAMNNAQTGGWNPTMKVHDPRTGDGCCLA